MISSITFFVNRKEGSSSSLELRKPFSSWSSSYFAFQDESRCNKAWMDALSSSVLSPSMYSHNLCSISKLLITSLLKVNNVPGELYELFELALQVFLHFLFQAGSCPVQPHLY